MSNFGKPLEEQTEKEIFNSINRFSMEAAQVAMGELNRRESIETRKEIKDFKDVLKKEIESNKKLSNAVLVFAIIQVLIAFIELIFNALSSEGPWVAFALEALVVLIIIFIFRASGLFKKEQ